MRNFILQFWPWLFVGIFTLLGVIEYRLYRKEKQDLEQADKSSADLPDTLVLQRRNVNISPREGKFFVFTMVLVILTIIAITAMAIISKHPDADTASLLAMTWDKLTDKPGSFTAVLILLPLAIFVPWLTSRISENEKLRLDRAGLTYCPPFTGLLKRWVPGWHIDWAEVKTISLGHLLTRGQLVISPENGKVRRLVSHLWEQEYKLKSGPKSFFMRIARQQQLQNDSIAMLELPLLKYIREKAGLKIDTKAHGDAGFDLAKNSRTRAAMVVLFGLLIYTIMDIPVITEMYVLEPPLWWFVTGGLFTLFIAGIWLSEKDIPVSHSWALGVLLGIVMAVALYPGLLRLNQLTDTRGLQVFEYQHTAPNRFEPVDYGLPILAMPSDDYWRSLPYDKLTSFSLRRGALGFYQVDMEPVYKKMRQFYCKKRAGDNLEKREACKGI